ncbi:MAG: glycosyltransferase, partial [Chloroflexota bacterium]
MKLLFVTPQLPWPPSQGTALRNFHLLKAAAGRHEVDLLSFADLTPWPAPTAGPLTPNHSPTRGEGSPTYHPPPRPAKRAGKGSPTTAGPPASVPPSRVGRGGRGVGPLSDLCRRIETVPVPRRPTTLRLRDLTLGWADMERRLWSPAFAARLAEMLRTGRYDAVQLEGFEVAGYLLGPAALRAEAHGLAPWQTINSELATRNSELPRRQAPRLIFDDHNAEYRLQESAARIDRANPRRWVRAAYSALQARRLRAREALFCAAADACLAVSVEDAQALEVIVPGLGPTVVPNGVDVEAMPAPRPGAEPSLFFSGKLDYRPNIDACEWLVERVLPRVRTRFPAARVVLAGRDPAPPVQRLARQGVEVTGALADDELARRRAEAWVYVVPMRMGSGVRFKVLEAMAAGVPL